MTGVQRKSTQIVQCDLGDRLRDLRVRMALTQAELATLANVAIKSVQSLEAGRGSKLSTFIAVLKALGCIDDLQAVAPRPSVSPMKLLKQQQRPTRVYQGRRVRHTEK